MLLLLACSDHDVSGKSEFVGADPLDTFEPDDTGDTQGPDEDCNGVDDDGDGEVDEGWPDDDGNGRVDCLDLECPALDMPAAGPVEPVLDCPALELADPWAMRVRWSADTPSSDVSERKSVTAPLVTQLSDDNGDSVINGADDPEIVLTVFGATYGGTLVVLDGLTGATK